MQRNMNCHVVYNSSFNIGVYRRLNFKVVPLDCPPNMTLSNRLRVGCASSWMCHMCISISMNNYLFVDNSQYDMDR